MNENLNRNTNLGSVFLSELEFSESIEILRQLLERVEARSVTYSEALQVRDDLFDFFEVLAEENVEVDDGR
jgi:hypothetical protein